MNARDVWWIGAMLALSSAASVAQTAPTPTTPPIIKTDFENGEGGWMVMGANAKMSIAHDAADVVSGNSAIRLDYSVEKGQFGVLILPTPNGQIADAKAFRFWLKSDSGSPMIVALQEKDGGRYMAAFTPPRDKWQRVELGLQDFVLSEEANDPKDPDNKLDMDQVEGVGIGDLTQLFAQSDDAQVASLLNLKTGAHHLLVDDFEASATPLAGGESPVSTAVRLDTFQRPQVGWLVVGDMRAAYVTGAVLPGRVLQASYRQTTGKIAGLVRPIQRGRLAGTNTLTIDIASTQPAKMLVQLEEKGGGKYNTILDLPGGNMVQHLSLPYAQMQAGTDSTDQNGKLDPDMIKGLTVVDLAGMLGGADADNVVTISNLKALTAK